MTMCVPENPDGLPAALIEAFSGQPHQGNGAAVVLLDRPTAPEWMQAVAGSLRQSETAFLLPWQGAWLLRWFTPTCEVPLCGHATLAAVLALGHWQLIEEGEVVRFQSRSGPLPSRCLKKPHLSGGGLGWIEIPGGALLGAEQPPVLERLLAEFLGCGSLAFWRSALGYAVALLPEDAPLDGMACLADRLDDDLGTGLVLMQAVARPPQQPGGPQAPEAVPELADLGAQADYRLRFFAPRLGIREDPVTGSAHALVARWWQERLGRNRVVGWQCSDRPGGVVSEGGASGMIRLTGEGVLLWDGRLNLLPPACPGASGWPSADQDL